MSKYAIGTDIGGSHISCALIDLEGKFILKESYTTEPVDNKASAEDILVTWTRALNTVISKIAREQLAGIGFAMPGPFDYNNGIALFTPDVAKFENLFNLNVAHQLQQMLGLEGENKIRFMNDAVSFAVGESWMGQGKGFNRTLAVTIGTGFGSGFIEDGIPVVNRPDVPARGYVYHLPFRDGIADEYFSGRWFLKRYAELSGKSTSGVKELSVMVDSDPIAGDLFREFGCNLAEFLAPLLLKFEAEALIIGGNIALSYPLFGEIFESDLSRRNVAISVATSDLKEDAALIGSARLFDDHFWQGVLPLLSFM